MVKSLKEVNNILLLIIFICKLLLILQCVKIRETGVIPPEHYSHDHLNEQREVPVEQPLIDRWRETFTKIQEEHEKAGEKIVWVVVDGFLLYWDQVCSGTPGTRKSLIVLPQAVVDSLDVRVFLRVPEAVLKQRRHERHGYHTAGKTI